jgi:hypothetical protein
MKCQSDYDSEREALFRQADECLEDWWDGEPESSEEPSKMAGEEDESVLIVKQEARKRGLLEGHEEAESL